MGERRCGTCAWWGHAKGKTYCRADIMWPYAYTRSSAFQAIQNLVYVVLSDYVGKNDGRDCPAWKKKARDA